MFSSPMFSSQYIFDDVLFHAIICSFSLNVVQTLNVDIHVQVDGHTGSCVMPNFKVTPDILITTET